VYILKIVDSSLIRHEKGLDKKLEALLDKFEREVQPYDRLSQLSLMVTPVGVLVTILLPLIWYQFVGEANPYSAISSTPIIYYILGGILAMIFLAKIPILYADYKKHLISRVKYKPVSGVCMCDLSQLRSHYRKMEKAATASERMRHAKLVLYYRKQIGWQT
jgi:hypothetical protein